MLLSKLSYSYSNNMVWYTALGTQQSHPIPSPFLNGGEGSSFPDLAPPDDVLNTESVLDIQPGDSGVVIEHQGDEFTHTWSAQWFIACSYIYPRFTGKVSSLNHFPLEPGCEAYSFLDQAVANFEDGLNSISYWFHWDTGILHIL